MSVVDILNSSQVSGLILTHSIIQQAFQVLVFFESKIVQLTIFQALCGQVFDSLLEHNHRSFIVIPIVIFIELEIHHLIEVRSSVFFAIVSIGSYFSVIDVRHSLKALLSIRQQVCCLDVPE